MRIYNYTQTWQTLLTPEIVSMLSAIHEYKGEQKPLLEIKSDALTHLLEIAKIQSTEASNIIEGISTSEERLKKILFGKAIPATKNEQEIVGYRDALTVIDENYAYLPVRPPFILQLHGMLYKYSGRSSRGAYKNADNTIERADIDGNLSIRFQPVTARETSESMNDLCAALGEVLNDELADPLLIIPMFILDFLCIRPFNDGNGRMSRLLTLLLLYRAGYTVGEYVSLERIIEESEEEYYEALRKSSQGWHENKNDYAPFVQYMLHTILTAYREFSSHANALITSGQSKSGRIAEVIRNTDGKITKAEIMEKCPNISQVTIQRTLMDLIRNGDILKIGGGRYTSYIWNREK